MEFYLDTEINLIIDPNGQGIKKLSEAESNILGEFIKHRGKCLSRDELMQAGWPKAVVVENSLNMAIRKLRTVGINIETVARKGYALVDDRVDFFYRIQINQNTSLLQEETSGIQYVSAIPEVGDVINEVVKQDSNQREIESEIANTDFMTTDSINTEYVTKRSNRKFLPYWIISVYIFLIFFVYLVLDGSKPDIKCFEELNTKVCTTYDSFDPILIKSLEPGFYLYGKTYDESENLQFIRIQD
ncbi:transcriptional regulator [Vibrio cholerae]|uniref:transcriptional regulator n=1 Tax=Vibrio cholerae TaxID=666 RepID=UPI000E6CC3FB|nr:helix-turn-helix domain-containing protein [Vibrio cholerae]RJK82831.1 hypothetical protein CHN45_17115 [Vibrio cholerae]